MMQNRSRILITLLALAIILCACGPGDQAGPTGDISTVEPPAATDTSGQVEAPVPPPAAEISPVPGEATLAPSSPTPPPASDSTPPVAEGEITIEQRTVQLDALAAFSASLSGEDPQADRRALVDYMIAAPEFEDAGLNEDGSAWGRFTDGRLVIIPNQAPAKGQGTASAGPRLAGGKVAAAPLRSPSVPPNVQTLRVAALPAAAPLAGIRSSAAPADSQGGELPESKRAVLVNAIPGWASGEHEDELVRMLMDKGYQVHHLPPYVEFLKEHMQGVGVFYFLTHGGTAWTIDDREVYGLMTPELRTPKGDATHNEDLRTYRLAFGLDKGRYYYAITSDFVREYMRFSRHSFVFIGACSGYNHTMRDAFEDAKANVYASWDAPVWPSSSVHLARTVFDLLLGTNVYYKPKPPDRSPPPLRPFDYTSVWQHLQEEGEDTDTRTGARLMVTQLEPGDFALLAPSIKYMEVNEGTLDPGRRYVEVDGGTGQPSFRRDVGDGLLTLYGIFGSDPGDDGRVTINEKPLKWTSWEKNKIVVGLPEATDLDGAGEVMVTVRGHDSNKVPLTRWETELHYSVETFGRTCTDPNDVHQDYVFDVVIRADIHPYREKLGDTPREPESVSYSPADISKAEFSFGGAARCSEYTGPNGEECYFLYEWGGMGQWDVYTPDFATGFQMWGQIDASKRTLDFNFWYGIHGQDFWKDLGATRRESNPCGDPAVQQPPWDMLAQLHEASPVTMQLGEEYDLEGGALSLGPDEALLLLGETQYTTFEWEGAVPEYAPDEETPG